MKTLLILSLCLVFLETTAQVKVDVGGKVENSANRRANNKTDEAIDKSFDKLEEGIGDVVRSDPRFHPMLYMELSQMCFLPMVQRMYPCRLRFHGS